MIDYAIKGAFINLDPHDIYVIWRGVEYTTSHKISSQSTGQSGSYSNSKKLPSQLNRRVSLIDYANKGAFINLDPHDIYVIWRGVEYTTSHKISSQSTGQSGSYSNSKKLPWTHIEGYPWSIMPIREPSLTSIRMIFMSSEEG